MLLLWQKYVGHFFSFCQSDFGLRNFCKFLFALICANIIYSMKTFIKNCFYELYFQEMNV